MGAPKKIWETASTGNLDPTIDVFLSSAAADLRLLAVDIQGSRAHAAMLGRTGILPEESSRALESGLAELLVEAEAGCLKVDPEAEDVHSFVEAELTSRLGDSGRCLHAGRSRNDQVALDLRLWLKESSVEIRRAILDAMEAVAGLAAPHTKTLMPGYTHLQRAQPVTFAHHLLAWAAALERDYGRFSDAAERADECPLGACALSGSGLPLDREATAAALGFARPSRNSMDAVGDHDAAVEFAAAAATLLMHLSRYSEEIVLWSSAEFGFVRVGKSASTGSSVMPQKRNPDPAELIRGKTGRAYGDLMGLLTVQKGLPLAYDRDLQEDKELVFDSGDTALAAIGSFAILVRALEPQSERMREAAEAGCLWAADAAEFLVLKGIPFRIAYAAARALVEAYAEAKGFGRVPPIAGLLASLGEEGLAALHPAWSGVRLVELVPYLSLDACVERRKAPGCPSPEVAVKELSRIASFLAESRKALDSGRA